MGNKILRWILIGVAVVLALAIAWFIWFGITQRNKEKEPMPPADVQTESGVEQEPDVNEETEDKSEQTENIPEQTGKDETEETPSNTESTEDESTENEPTEEESTEDEGPILDENEGPVV